MIFNYTPNIVLPKWISNKAIMFYVAALLLVTGIYFRYSIPWYYMLSGAVSVVAFLNQPLAYYNNDVPVSLRLTRNLHAPEHNMLFHFDLLIDEINHLQSTSNKSAWIQLIDKLRVDGLLDYWMSKEYHDAAANELVEIDWTKQPRSSKATYERPIWFLKFKRRFKQIGSFCKQKCIRC